ncbi:hypothetical protein F5148DRAFT_1289913 [Russula earlei]|uniref:Uncharacterized protein n=1 Tax=Russula earlei TaxID=71964 RepID=A0ACC0TYC8_9AGAM|nr:hypothetical protein F5148DRAFT_1289913 [Russula earlei]
MSHSATHRRGSTLALRILFRGRARLRVLRTSKDDISSLLPWLRDILTDLRLPHPKSSNVIKPNDTTSAIEMYWDVEFAQVGPRTLHQPFSLIQDTHRPVDVYIRKITEFELPAVERFAYTEATAPASGELEIALLAMFDTIGLSTPGPGEDLAAYIPALLNYIQTLRIAADSEAAARVKAELALAEERARHARILQDIQKECQEPFVVPALLEAFVAVSRVVDEVVD